MNIKQFNQMTMSEKQEWINERMIDYTLAVLPENEMALVANYLNVNYNGLVY